MTEILAMYTPEATNENGCRIWTGTRTTGGYGTFGLDGKTYYAHRVSYEMATNDTLGERLIRHSCDTPSCVNVDHLQPGVEADNSMDAVERLRYPYGSKHWNYKLSPAECRDIRAMYASGGITQREIAKLFGTSQSNVSGICIGKYRTRSS